MTNTTTATDRTTAHRRRSRLQCSAFALLVVGGAFRIYLAATLPVGYDESYVMALGLNTMDESNTALLLEVPLTQSSAVTPLWWWIQYLPHAALPEISLYSLRMVPAALGLLTVWLAWRTAAARFGRRIALVFLAFASLSDILIFTNSRGEFAESFTVPLIVLAVCQMGSPGGVARRGVIWALLLLTGLVKGVFVIGLMLIAEVVLTMLMRIGVRRHLRDLAISLTLALIPTVAFLMWGNAHFAGRAIEHEATTAPNVFALVRTLLFDYTTVKEHVTGSVRNAAFIALDFDVWPVMALTAPLLITAWIVGALRCVRHGWRPRSRIATARTALIVWTLAGAAIVIGRGTLGARFHLMYVPALWMLAAMWLGRRRFQPRTSAIMAGGIAVAVYVGFTASWSSWTDGSIAVTRWIGVSTVLGLAVAAAVWLTVRCRRSPAVTARVGFAGFAVAALAIAGPVAWASYARFEPMPRGEELALLDAFRSGKAPAPPDHGRSLYIDLTNCYLKRSGSQADQRQALHYARLEVRRVPDDWQAWAYLGETLLRAGEDPAEARRAWQRSFELEPTEVVQEKLNYLEEWMRSNGSPEQ